MQTKVLVYKKEILFDLLKFSTLIAIALAAPLVGNQIITGTIVNATLFIATIFLGYRSAIAAGLIPSLVAIISGTLPLVLAPMVPFIICSNAILILTFAFFRRKNYWFGVFVSSLMKFIFLWGASSILVDFIYKGQIAKNIASMMSYPQLITALLGGVIAYALLKTIKKDEIKI